jgi:hypothetical protein
MARAAAPAESVPLKESGQIRMRTLLFLLSPPVLSGSFLPEILSYPAALCKGGGR